MFIAVGYTADGKLIYKEAEIQVEVLDIPGAYVEEHL